MTAYFDKLMTLFQECLGRPIQLGDAFLSADEEMLVDLIKLGRSAEAYAELSHLVDAGLECKDLLANPRCQLQQ
ncbi:hypothetical protein ATN00_07730 [Sphingobium baderi]|uniref:Uncharacterized protein n=1 Tax=Sphingobium baderi TaxID=1332080 RepID=A0A0S3EXP7_9SPHN|nr:hypothetical protein ATN00_07730 [Sphingobium baderi]